MSVSRASLGKEKSPIRRQLRGDIAIKIFQNYSAIVKNALAFRRITREFHSIRSV